LDWDDDKVGNACDNCIVIPNGDCDLSDLYCDTDGDGDADPWEWDLGFQHNADGDWNGDACDNDDDNDGVLDGDDNCPVVHNPGQVDFDGNGLGTACDVDEMEELEGRRLGAAGLEGFFEWTVGEIREIPVIPCKSNCPDWMPQGFGTKVRVRFEKGLGLLCRVVDGEGNVVGRVPETVDLKTDLKTYDGQEVVFRPTADYHYKAPGGTGDPFRGGEYTLEIMHNGTMPCTSGCYVQVEVESEMP